MPECDGTGLLPRSMGEQLPDGTVTGLCVSCQQFHPMVEVVPPSKPEWKREFRLAPHEAMSATVEFNENRLTDLMEFVGRKLMGDEWNQANMDQRRILKQNVLPIALAVFEFVETNPNEKVLAIKEALQYTFMEYGGVLPDQEQDVLEAWNAAFPEHPLDLTDTGEEE